VAGIFKDGLLILMVTIFFLVEGPLFIRRMRQAFGADHYLPQNMTALAQGMISYFGLRALVNLVVAVATGVMLWFFNIEYAGLWAVLIFFLASSIYWRLPFHGPPLLLAYAQGGLGLVIIGCLQWSSTAF
jgi:predicted PurR-regulated permease PerM